MIVLDASVLIAYLDANDAHHAAAEELLVTDGELLVNSVTLAEILVGPVRSGQAEAVQTALSDLQIDEVPLPVDAALLLARLRVETGLRLPDCAVLLTAEQEKGTVASFDRSLVRTACSRGIATVPQG